MLFEIALGVHVLCLHTQKKNTEMTGLLFFLKIFPTVSSIYSLFSPLAWEEAAAARAVRAAEFV